MQVLAQISPSQRAFLTIPVISEYDTQIQGCGPEKTAQKFPQCPTPFQHKTKMTFLGQPSEARRHQWIWPMDAPSHLPYRGRGPPRRSVLEIKRVCAAVSTCAAPSEVWFLCQCLLCWCGQRSWPQHSTRIHCPCMALLKGLPLNQRKCCWQYRCPGWGGILRIGVCGVCLPACLPEAG